MAYDLVLRRRIQRDYSRGDEPARPASPKTEALSFLVANAALIVAGAAESASYRDYRAGLTKTQELPAVSMSELVYGPRRES